MLAVLALTFGCKGQKNTRAAATGTSRTQPNIIFILADDPGYADIGPYRQEKI